MSAPKSTTWALEPHTKAKHEILKRYLRAWTPILAQGGFPQILYIDGFAGPGRYEGGEEGSPVIALNAALAHRDRITGEMLFQFIEKDSDRAAMLRRVLDEIPKPSNFKIRISTATFEESTREILEYCKSRGRALPPTFAFVDPFGWTGIPFSLLRDILSHPSCEVLVNFMYEEINRFLGHPDQEQDLDQLFGTPDWRPLVQISGTAERRRAIHGLYQKKLESAATFVRSFEMRNRNDATDYFLFFATKNTTGLRKMKEAMWGVDQSGEFTFSDGTNPDQMLLFGKQPNLAVLRNEIVGRFSGAETTVGTVELFVVEATAFRETHYKPVLKELEMGVPPGMGGGQRVGPAKEGDIRGSEDAAAFSCDRVMSAATIGG